MNRLGAWLAHLPVWVRDSVLFLLAGLDTWFNLSGTAWEPWRIGCAALALLVLPVRRRAPLVVVLLTLPATAVLDLWVAPFAALYTLASRNRAILLLVLMALCTGVADADPWPLPLQPGGDRADTMANVVYGFAWALTPVLLGQLTLAYRDLNERSRRIRKFEAHQREVYAQTVLSQERAQIAREMHDVVSHQVSLIAVHAGALQVSTTDPDTRAAAATVRQLATATLDELRGMVGLLRASDGFGDSIAPQPTIDDLRGLIASAGIEVSLSGQLPRELASPVQRTVYRTVQEAITNIRKHAPGAAAEVTLWHQGPELGVTITNGPSSQPPLALPQSGHGLIGLRERATALNGVLDSGATVTGGFTVALRIPAA
ncbi:sensor histidine kinase [Pseudonocardia spinosispora]|uniref:sensor histidine kinase n=1 Tax=Pseudonocardia spinosispora TaxID=103441 RepID=UPI000686E933|nr:sensor histidine kinase [Pseudonocardia spinosispora]